MEKNKNYFPGNNWCMKTNNKGKKKSVEKNKNYFPGNNLNIEER